MWSGPPPPQLSITISPASANVRAGASQAIKQVRFDRVNPRIGPDVQTRAKPFSNQTVADCEHVMVVEHEHLVDNLEGAHSVGFKKMLDLRNNL